VEYLRYTSILVNSAVTKLTDAVLSNLFSALNPVIRTPLGSSLTTTTPLSRHTLDENAHNGPRRPESMGRMSRE
jgi:hypothetical protein